MGVFRNNPDAIDPANHEKGIYPLSSRDAPCFYCTKPLALLEVGVVWNGSSPLTSIFLHIDCSEKLAGHLLKDAVSARRKSSC
mgnify:FL=1